MASNHTEAVRKICLYDQDIREPLFDYLDEHFGKTRVFEEKNIGKSRADIILLGEESIIGLEIKSDADSYERLKRQVRDYNKYCDRNIIVVGKSHERHVQEHVPVYWGIWVVSIEKENTIVIKEQRKAMENPKINKQLQLTMLWRPELQRILERNCMPGYKQKSKKFVQQKLLEKIEWTQLKRQLCDEMFERDYTLWDEEVEAYKNTLKLK